MWPRLTRDDLALAVPLDAGHLVDPSKTFVFFDIGSVLIDLDWDSFQEALVPLAAPGASVEAALASADVRAMTRSWSTGRMGPADFARSLLGALGHTREGVERLGACALLDVKAASSLIVGPVRARSLRLVKRLREAGVGVGVLSNAVPWHETDIEATLRLRDVFDVVVFSQDVGFEKPDDGIYAAADTLARRFLARRRAGGAASQTEQEPCFFFVDDLAANVRAAQARGWNASLVELIRAELKTSYLAERLTESDWTAQSQRSENLVFGDQAARRVEALFEDVESVLRAQRGT